MKPAWVLGAAGALGLGVWLAVAPGAQEPAAAAPEPARAMSLSLLAAPVVGEAAPAPAAAPATAPAQLPASLQDTEADGGWQADAQGRLVVELAVRRRFDYWLSTLGEWPPEAIGARVLQAARRDLPPTVVAQLEALWARYVNLQRHAWQRAAQPADRATWRAALEERQSVRRQLLGRDWADAFYADEEQALWADILDAEAGRPPRVADAPLPPEHPQAAQRVAELEAQWAQWERRVEEARGELARLRAARELSDPQREQAAQAWLAQRFSGGEQVRVRSLLGWPSASGA